MKQIYRNNLKNRNFGKKAPQNVCAERVAIAQGQDTSEQTNFEKKPTMAKTDSCACFGISAFDLDHTLVSTNSSILFYRFLISRGFFHSISIVQTMVYSLRHTFLNLGLAELHEKVFSKFLKGASLGIIQEQVAEFLKNDFYRFLYPPSFARLRRAQHEGHHTVILSNGPSFLVGPIAEYLQVNEWYSSNYSVNTEGNFEAVESVLLGEGKASCIESLVRKLKTTTAKVIAYSDSDLDLPFLFAAGVPIAVNPNSKLLKVSKAYSWEIL